MQWLCIRRCVDGLCGTHLLITMLWLCIRQRVDGTYMYEFIMYAVDVIRGT